MNTTLSTARQSLHSLLHNHLSTFVAVVVFIVMISAMSINVFAQEDDGNNDVCTTSATRVALVEDRGVVQVFSDFGAHNPNGMLITEIPLSSIPRITDAQKASGENVWLLSKDSEYASGWSVKLYWNNNRYGATVTNGSFADNTGALCVL